MDICLFNMSFGESIYIYNHQPDTGLLVDCGISHTAPKEKTVQLFDAIAQRITTTPLKQDKIDALITHFHMDHISGLIHYAKNKTISFNTLYLPDIYNLHSSSTIIVPFVLLDHLLSSTRVNAKVALKQLVDGLVGSSKHISFLKHGDEFHGAFRVLAPFQEDVEKTANELFKEFKIKDKFPVIWEYLVQTSRLLINELNERNNEDSIKNTLNQGNIPSQTENKQIDDDEIDDDYSRLIDVILGEDKFRESLNNLGHLVNIIFHSLEDEPQKNVLFTGDATPDVMKNIESENKLAEYHLYERYALYKVQHHGTYRHYYKPITIRFVEKAIISNGSYSPKNTQIFPAYCSDPDNKPKLFCTNCNNCEQFTIHGSRPNYCNERNNDRVFPAEYFPISVP